MEPSDLVPNAERDHEQNKQERSPTRITDPERTIGKIGHGRARCSGCDNHKPINKRMEFFHLDLCENRDEENGNEDDTREGITKVHGHRDRVAARFAQGGGDNFYHPKSERDGGYFTEDFFSCLIHDDFSSEALESRKCSQNRMRFASSRETVKRMSIRWHRARVSARPMPR